MNTVKHHIAEFSGTITGLVGISSAGILSYVSPILSVVVLSLTTVNLALEIRKKLRK